MKDLDHSGMLITFEGGEGSGKSTVSKSVFKSLSERGLDVLHLREPGGTQIGENIRNVLFDKETSEIQSDKTEVLLFQASRAQIVGEAIRPHMNNGGIVLLDRYGDSSVAYQGYARGLGASKIAELNDYSTDGLEPDLTIWLDVAPEIGLRRARVRTQNWNHLDEMDLEFHQDVRYAYQTLHAYDESDRWHRIDAQNSPEIVIAETIKVVEDRLRMKGLLEGVVSHPERLG